MKIIFLDFDGVITTRESKWAIDKSKIALVEEIIKATSAKIVIISSWKNGCSNGDEFVEKMFGIRRNRSIELTRDSLFIDSIYDVTHTSRSCRGDEVKDWINTHEVESYVIIDDECPMLDEQLFNYVQPDGEEGICDREVKLSIKILNNERIMNPCRLNHILFLKRYEKLQGRKSNIDELMSNYIKKYI